MSEFTEVLNSPNLPWILGFTCVIAILVVYWLTHNSPKQLAPTSTTDQSQTRTKTTYDNNKKKKEVKSETIAPTDHYMELKGYYKNSNPSQFGTGKKEMKIQAWMEGSNPTQGIVKSKAEHSQQNVSTTTIVQKGDKFQRGIRDLNDSKNKPFPDGHFWCAEVAGATLRGDAKLLTYTVTENFEILNIGGWGDLNDGMLFVV